jgi:PhnB protein
VLHRVGGDEIVAQLAVGDATFWVHDEAPEYGNVSPETAGGTTVRLLLVVDDPRAVYDRAIAAGATPGSPVGEEHGWLVGRLDDPFGHHWEIGKPLQP